MLKSYLRFIKAKKHYKRKNTALHSWNFGSNVRLGFHCNIAKRTILGDNVEIGDYTYLNANKYWITVESNVKIGKYCSIAPGIHIGAGNHNYKNVTTHPFLFDRSYEPIFKFEANMQLQNGLIDCDTTTKIGNDVWIGLHAIIKRGVTIGNGAIIAAGSVVVKDVPDYAIVGGNPAKVIKYRTSEENISFFSKHEDAMWWNWDVDTIRQNLHCLYDFDKYREKLSSML